MHVKKKKIKYEDVKEYISRYGYELLEDTYISNGKNMKILDGDGYLYSVTFGNFKDYMENCHKKFDIVNNFNPYSIHNINNFIQSFGYNTIVLDNEYCHGSKYKLNLLCECGETFKASWDKIRNRGKMVCPRCLRTRESYNEKKVRQVLSDSHINFIQEKREYINHDTYVVFDFYLPEYRTAIEVNGEQHYHPVTFGGISLKKAVEKFNKQVIMDEKKDKYCSSNNINLIKIPYWEFKKGNKYIERINNIIRED